MKAVPDSPSVTGSFYRRTNISACADIDLVRMVRLDAVSTLVQARLELLRADLLLEQADAVLAVPGNHDVGPQADFSYRKSLLQSIAKFRSFAEEQALPSHRLDAVSARAMAECLWEAEEDQVRRVVEEIQHEIKGPRPTIGEAASIFVEILHRELARTNSRIRKWALIAALERVLTSMFGCGDGLHRLREFIFTHRAFHLTHGAHPPRIHSFSICNPPVVALA
jgi:hypothetical protein